MMIVNAAKDFDTNLKLESKQFTIGDTNKVIDLLISQYKYPVRTLVQEYICNAIDASKEKDLNFDISSIKVELPTDFNKMMFSVRDFGVGLSHDRIHQVFCVMGASTKSKDNNHIGGFGLGAKSALAYTDHFFITSFLDGVKSDYLVRKAPIGGITLDSLGSEPTTEENGTLIQVKAKQRSDFDKFIQAYERLTLFWDVKPSCSFNREVKKVKIGELLTLSDVEVIGKEYSEDLWINLGGVLYALKKESVKGAIAKTVIVNIPVGKVLPLQTREGLNSEHKESMDNIRAYINQAEKELNDYVTSFKGKSFKESFDDLSKLSKLVSGSVQLKEVLAVLGYKELCFDIDIKTYTRKAERHSWSKRNNRTKTVKTSTGKELDLSEIKLIMEMDATPKNARLHSYLASNDYAVEIENAEHLALIKQVAEVKKLSDVAYTEVKKERIQTTDTVFIRKLNHVEQWYNVSDLPDNVCYAVDGCKKIDAEAAQSIGYTVYVTKSCYVKRLKNGGIKTIEEALKEINIDSKQLAVSKASSIIKFGCYEATNLLRVVKNESVVETLNMVCDSKYFHAKYFDQINANDFKRAAKLLYKLSRIKTSSNDDKSSILRKYINAKRGV